MNANQLNRLMSYESVLTNGELYSISSLAAKAKQSRQTVYADLMYSNQDYFVVQNGIVIQLRQVEKPFAKSNPSREAIAERHVINKYAPLSEKELIDYPVNLTNEAIRPLIKSPDDVVKLIRFLITAYEASMNPNG